MMGDRDATEVGKYLSVKDLAVRWSCHRSIIYRQINAGNLAALHIGQAIRIAISEVERFEAEYTR
ncbi:hypothetical protein IM25_06540 [Rhodococcus sp. p52]|nr:hypothetical protein IM25_06540 [Rhodococcus sp. p52]